MANPLLNGFPQMPQMANNKQNYQLMPNGALNFKEVLKNPQVKQQIKQLYSIFQGNPNAIIQALLQNSPVVKNNPMLGTLLQGGGNPDAFLKEFGISQQDIADILKQ